MNKLSAIGAPFNINHSSCYAHKPKRFKWTNEKGYPTVVMDRAITRSDMLDGRPNKYAWVCESRAILSNHDQILKNPRVHSSYKKIFINDKTKLHLGPNLIYCPAGSNLPWLPMLNELPLKNKMCSMIASSKQMCQGHKYRHQIAKKYMSQLDLYGGACNSPRFGFDNKTTDGHPDKASAIVPYRFSVVMENDSYPDYYTEKITDCFASWTVPIYWGNPSIGENFNLDGIIILTDRFDVSSLTVELYEKMLPAIEENNKIVQQLQMADDIIYTNIMEEQQ